VLPLRDWRTFFLSRSVFKRIWSYATSTKAYLTVPNITHLGLLLEIEGIDFLEFSFLFTHLSTSFFSLINAVTYQLKEERSPVCLQSCLGIYNSRWAVQIILGKERGCCGELLDEL